MALFASIAAGAAALALSSAPISAAAPLSGDDNGQMVEWVMQSIKDRLPPAASTVILAPKARFAPKEGFTPALVVALRSEGYGLAADRRLSPDAHVIRYELSPAWDGVFLRLQIDQTETARLYLHNQQGDLAPAGPLSVREVR